MNKKFDQIKSRKNTNSMKWDAVSLMYPEVNHDVLPLWVADMDFSCAEPILEAMNLTLQREIFGYSCFDDEYYQILQSWFKKYYHYEINKEDVFYSPGVVPALGALIRSLTKENEGVIIQPPVYYPFRNMINNNHRRVIENKLINNNEFYSINFDELESQMADKNTKLFILCSPHNPVGRVWTPCEIEKIVSLCIQYDIYLISDEIHCDLLRKNQTFHSLGHYKEHLEKLVICTAPSKSFNLAGLHLSNIIIFNPEIKEIWEQELQGRMGTSHPSPLAISATKAAYAESEDWLNAVNQYIDYNFDLLKDFLSKHLPKATYQIPEGTYLAWINFAEYDIPNLTQRLLNDGKVALEGGEIFCEDAKSYQRINVACPTWMLEQALEKVRMTIEEACNG